MALTAPEIDEELGEHCSLLRSRLMDGRVVPFLGAGANLCGRPADVDWLQDAYPPNGSELATYLAEPYPYLPAETREQLIRVSQYIQTMAGGPVLLEKLHELFSKEYQPTAVHHLLARLAKAVRHWRQHDHPKALYQLVITTNYDDALEKAFEDIEYDLVTYMARGEHPGMFLHRTPAGDERLIEEPNKYRELSLADRTVILKFHGAVDRDSAEKDSYVITEDHYIDYLARRDISNLLPASLMASMEQSHFLFLGYSLSDWNLRVILQRLRGERPFDDQYRSWAIQASPSRLERQLWSDRNVYILDRDLSQYVHAVEELVVPAEIDVPEP